MAVSKGETEHDLHHSRLRIWHPHGCRCGGVAGDERIPPASALSCAAVAAGLVEVTGRDTQAMTARAAIVVAVVTAWCIGYGIATGAHWLAALIKFN